MLLTRTPAPSRPSRRSAGSWEWPASRTHASLQRGVSAARRPAAVSADRYRVRIPFELLALLGPVPPTVAGRVACASASAFRGLGTATGELLDHEVLGERAGAEEGVRLPGSRRESGNLNGVFVATVAGPTASPAAAARGPSAGTAFTVPRVICSRDSSDSTWDNSSESPAICSRNSPALDRQLLSLASNAAINDGTTPPARTPCPHLTTGSPRRQWRPLRTVTPRTPANHPNEAPSHDLHPTGIAGR